ncbi:alpha/beta hydrolase [Brevundimonas sp. AJA228-03]|uniref:alpha/beta fold hydrolase n=1 Tax=Brevundimonas sp. AJA228-03 TaxID=2752515 RepID=UPI001ADFFD3F|nr:alpha/beta hydrolase [Brevundimonas sp. AJA228-03]QTN19822.1 alpha/beta hydrolase [Brevundimonas sp. AJA228-03]
MQTRIVETDGLTQQVLEDGPEGAPLVLLIHGFPELGLSWRAQVKALGAAGYRAVAPDMRGYGGTDKPGRTEEHTILHLVGDMVDLVRALGRSEGTVVGHDWGAPVAWHCALMRPDLFTAVAGLSVPFQPRRPGGPPTPAMAALARRAGKGELYMNQFQAPDAHRIFEADVATGLRKGFYSYDGATPDDRQSTGFIAPGHDFLSEVPDDATLPPWMSQGHFAEYVSAFGAGGFKGPIDWYRCLDLNWSLTAFLQGRKIPQPSMFMVGQRDPVRHYAGQHEAGLKDWLTDLRSQTVLPGAGHWLQQERPEEVNAALIGFLKSL